MSFSKSTSISRSYYRKSPDSSRVPDTGRGSRQIVLIEAWGFYPAFTVYAIDDRAAAASVLQTVQ